MGLEVPIGCLEYGDFVLDWVALELVAFGLAGLAASGGFNAVVIAATTGFVPDLLQIVLWSAPKANAITIKTANRDITAGRQLL